MAPPHVRYFHRQTQFHAELSRSFTRVVLLAISDTLIVVLVTRKNARERVIQMFRRIAASRLWKEGEVHGYQPDQRKALTPTCELQHTRIR